MALGHISFDMSVFAYLAINGSERGGRLLFAHLQNLSAILTIIIPWETNLPSLSGSFI